MGLADWLDWEEKTFRGLLAGWRRFGWSAPTSPDALAGVAFETLGERLGVLARLLTGAAVRVRVGAGVGGLRGHDLLLPERICLGGGEELDADAYRVQVVTLSGMHGRPSAGISPVSDTFEGALEALRRTRAAVDAMAADLPGFRASHDRVMAKVLERRRVLTSSLDDREALLEDARRRALEGGRPWEDESLCRQLVGLRRGRRRSPPIPIWSEWLERPEDAVVTGAPGAGERGAEGPTTELEAPATSAIRRVDVDEEEGQGAPPGAPFERAETLDRYRGGRRDLDGTDELGQHLDALDEVDLGDLIRTRQSAGSILRMDLDVVGEIADAASDPGLGRGIAYDEWDARQHVYRKGWCTVYPRAGRIGDARWAVETLRTHRRLVRRLRLRLEAHRAGLRPAPRQLDGEDIDLEAAIGERVAIRTGHGGDPRLYLRETKRRRDFATLVLIDASMSTDSWVGGRRILDVAREAALVLGEVAHELGDRLEIFAFASETRNRCYVWTLHREGEAWSLGKRRLAGLTPRGYTRIGPALRHMTAVLAATPAERRLLLLISDGKPTDYDRYEGRYGIADVRQALREAHEREIHTHALAVDEVAREVLPALFGRGGFDILPKPDRLVESLSTVYGRLTAR
ncbi:MAG TPA: VWA domain-containing protein [Myxococcota bacterium]|nr:VWA domain-containing protein [Myxococcota bacterium]